MLIADTNNCWPASARCCRCLFNVLHSVSASSRSNLRLSFTVQRISHYITTFCSKRLLFVARVLRCPRTVRIYRYDTEEGPRDELEIAIYSWGTRLSCGRGMPRWTSINAKKTGSTCDSRGTKLPLRSLCKQTSCGLFPKPAFASRSGGGFGSR